MLDAFFPLKLVINAATLSCSRARRSIPSPTPAARRPPTLRRACTTASTTAGTPVPTDRPKLIYNPAAFAPQAVRRSRRGFRLKAAPCSAERSEGAACEGDVHVPEGGSFNLICNVHPACRSGGRHAAAPLSPSQVTAKSLTKSRQRGRRLCVPAPPNTVFAGVGSTTAILGFFPRVLKAKAGTTVTFLNRSPSEVHNVAFGPAKYLLAFSKKTDLGADESEPGDAAISVWHQRQGRLHLRRHEPRQRVPVDSAHRGIAEGTLPKAAKVTFTESRYVQVHLLLAWSTWPERWSSAAIEVRSKRVRGAHPDPRPFHSGARGGSASLRRMPSSPAPRKRRLVRNTSSEVWGRGRPGDMGTSSERSRCRDRAHLPLAYGDDVPHRRLPPIHGRFREADPERARR